MRHKLNIIASIATLSFLLLLVCTESAHASMTTIPFAKEIFFVVTILLAFLAYVFSAVLAFAILYFTTSLVKTRALSLPITFVTLLCLFFAALYITGFTDSAVDVFYRFKPPILSSIIPLILFYSMAVVGYQPVKSSSAACIFIPLLCLQVTPTLVDVSTEYAKEQNSCRLSLSSNYRFPCLFEQIVSTKSFTKNKCFSLHTSDRNPLRAYRFACLIETAIQEKDYGVCEYLNREARTICESFVAAELNDEARCASGNSRVFQYSSSLCYLQIAIKNKRPELCMRIPTQHSMPSVASSKSLSGLLAKAFPERHSFQKDSELVSALKLDPTRLRDRCIAKSGALVPRPGV